MTKLIARQPSFRIEVADGWVHSTNKRTQTQDDFGNLISIHGGTRGECIEALPPEELKKLEAVEAERGAILREQMRARRAHDVFGGRREVPGE